MFEVIQVINNRQRHIHIIKEKNQSNSASIRNKTTNRRAHNPKSQVSTQAGNYITHKKLRTHEF
jgi:hypothetical protein